MTLAIERLASESPPDEQEIDSFLEGHDFPLQEGPTTTFVYSGEADEIHLRHFIYGLPSSQPFHRIDGTDLWYLSLELPESSRIEYKIDVVRGTRHEWILDPRNPLTARDPFGANSVCQSAGYEPPEWTRPDPDARQGELRELGIRSEIFGEERPFWLYEPARFRSEGSHPLLVVHDGRDFLRYSGLRTVLDNLVYRLEIPQLLVALIESPNRLEEYAGDPCHARFVTDELLPLLESSYAIDPDPAARGLMGASFGAVASLSTAWRRPGRFGRLLLLSGSFAFSDVGDQHERGPTFDPVVRFMNAFRTEPGRPAEKLFVGCGIYESLIYENRSLVPFLQGAGLEVRYVEARDGHNWENWRDQLREGLSWLFPGPLWMVYE